MSDNIEATKYTLTVTREQAGVIQDALESYARLRAGQIDMVIIDTFRDRFITEQCPGFTHQVVDHLCGELKKQIFPELYLNSYYGVGGSVYPTASVAWDMMQVVRHRLAWDRLADKGRTEPEFYGVQYNRPMQFGSEPLATIERKEAD